jgi:hypothetical protein
VQCASLRDYGERILGWSARETHEAAALGRALRLFPGLEDLLLDGRTNAEAAAVLADLGCHPEAIRPDDAWLDVVTRKTAKRVRKAVAQRLREVVETPVRHRVTLDLSDRGIADLERARALASPVEKKPVGPSEAVEVALRHYVAAKDPLERTPGTRRMAPTDDPLSPKTRSVPADQDRRVRLRAEGKCRIPFCDNTLFVERVHVFQRHCDGGSREATNLDLHCKKHHRMQERGEIRNLGTTENPLFVDAEGRSMHERRSRRPRARPPPPT